MADNNFLKAVSRYLPLLRAPLLLNNIICLVLSGLVSHDPIYQAQLALISVSFLTCLIDLFCYDIRKRAAHHDRIKFDQDVHVAGFVVVVDGLLSVALLIIWIIGLVAFGGWDPLISIIATFGAFIAWSFHLISFSIQTYIWTKVGQRASRRCPNCDYDLRLPAASTNITDFGDQNKLQGQAGEPDIEVSGSASEYDETETDCLILKDGEDEN